MDPQAEALRAQLTKAEEKWLELPQPSSEHSAVLVILGEREGTYEIVLTLRTDMVESHKGQVSFPGGRFETGDQSLLETALRETKEEIGLLAKDIQILGRLPVTHTHKQVPIYPWVGVMTLPHDFVPSDEEVARIFYLPVERLVRENIRPVNVTVGSFKLESTGIDVDGELVWGATAHILSHLEAQLIKSHFH